MSPEGGNNGGSAMMSYTASDLWLEIALLNNTTVRLTLHNTTPDTGYEILSRVDPVNGGWRSEQFIFGTAGQDWTQTTVPLTGHQTVFFTAGISEDTDGDGLTDSQERFSTGTDPNNPDTGNTGLSDGYKDEDGDGWTNLDELRNGTNPNQWNAPSATRLRATRGASGTVTLEWDPAAGSVTSYKIFRSPGCYEPPTMLAEVGPTVNIYTDPQPVQYYPAACLYSQVSEVSYFVRAQYSGGMVVSSQPARPYHSHLSFPAYVIRGRSGQPYLAASDLPEELEAVEGIWYYNTYHDGDFDVFREQALAFQGKRHAGHLWLRRS